ncbi:YlbF family regulator [Alicyclobacillus tolerans]|uniref:YlbF family regulator n=1 Tax=Alicyclobacillus tolerans TaxID=90970 RepID=UPI003B782DCD
MNSPKPVDMVELLSLTEELADAILESDEVKAYQEAEAKLRNNSKARKLLQQFQDLTEQIAELQARGVPAIHMANMLKTLESVKQELDSEPEAVLLQKSAENVENLLEQIGKQMARPLTEPYTFKKD